MKKMKYFLLLLIFLHTNLFSIKYGKVYFRDNELTQEERQFFSKNYNQISDFDIHIKAFLVVSGIKSSPKFNDYKKIFKTIKDRISREMYEKDISRKLDKAKYVLKWIHRNIFREYDIRSNSIKDVLDKGKYDCLTSSIIYTIIAIGLNIEIKNIVVENHTFCKIRDQKTGKFINIETTSPYGFDPGKEEIIRMKEEMVYVTLPKTDYQNEKEISYYELTGKIYYEQLSETVGKNSNYEILVNNLIKSKKAYLLSGSFQTYSNIKSFLVKIIKRKFDNNKYYKALRYIKEGLLFTDNDDTFQKIHIKYFSLMAKSMLPNYSKAISIVQRGLLIYPNSPILFDRLEYFLVQWGNSYFDKGGYKEAIHVYDKAKEYEIKSHIINKNMITCYYNFALDNMNAENFERAICYCTDGLERFPQNYRLNNLLKDIYYNAAVVEYNKDNFDESLEYCNIGLEKFSDAKNLLSMKTTVLAGYKIFYYNKAVDFYRLKNYKKAYKLCEKALTYSSKKNQIYYDLIDLKKKCEFYK